MIKSMCGIAYAVDDVLKQRFAFLPCAVIRNIQAVRAGAEGRDTIPQWHHRLSVAVVHHDATGSGTQCPFNQVTRDTDPVLLHEAPRFFFRRSAPGCSLRARQLYSAPTFFDLPWFVSLCGVSIGGLLRPIRPAYFPFFNRFASFSGSPGFIR